VSVILKIGNSTDVTWEELDELFDEMEELVYNLKCQFNGSWW
jgi:hypothetical protein